VALPLYHPTWGVLVMLGGRQAYLEEVGLLSRVTFIEGKISRGIIIIYKTRVLSTNTVDNLPLQVVRSEGKSCKR
jgi:hypothetical protein